MYRVKRRTKSLRLLASFGRLEVRQHCLPSYMVWWQYVKFIVLYYVLVLTSPTFVWLICCVLSLAVSVGLFFLYSASLPCPRSRMCRQTLDWFNQSVEDDSASVWIAKFMFVFRGTYRWRASSPTASRDDCLCSIPRSTKESRPYYDDAWISK